MACAASDIIAILDRLAPEEAAEPWDSVGLQVGSRSRTVSRLLLALEITGTVVGEAEKLGADMIVTHHPLFFRPVARIDEDEPTGCLAARLIRMNMAVYAAHTNLDKAEGGVNDQLIRALGVEDAVRTAGQPFLRVGALPRAVSGARFAGYVAARLSSANVRTVGAAPDAVRRIAVGSGASGDIIEAAAQSGADAFVVGEVKYHQALEALERGQYCVEAGHFETEWPVMAFLKRHLQKALDDLQYKVDIKLSETNGSPFLTVGE